MVLTTNYDNLLELYGQKMSKPMESINLNDNVKVLQWVQSRIKYGVCICTDCTRIPVP
ncbi:FAM118A isoform X1 [Pelobates cultripes]|uniref:FAM118A isoform X1 n=1 Tax=Pelobates cultripes TaxID=61616 RepID=A0AAD1W1G7_PELCU|nr:FAM118A isoform X1 [Pelobates cultripes]